LLISAHIARSRITIRLRKGIFRNVSGAADYEIEVNIRVAGVRLWQEADKLSQPRLFFPAADYGEEL